MNLSEKLKVLRKASGKSREVVANDLGIKPRTLQAYETGERIPTVDTIVLIASYYEVTTDFLLGMVEKSDYISEKKKIFSENIARKLIDSFDARSDEAKLIILDFLEDFVKTAKKDEQETLEISEKEKNQDNQALTYQRIARGSSGKQDTIAVEEDYLSSLPKADI